MYLIICRYCRITLNQDSYRVACPTCGGPLDFQYSNELGISTTSCNSMWKYRDRLPVCQSSKIVSLQEGATPLQMARCYKGTEAYLKNETLNPTGSHKDRALSIGVTKALEFGYDTVMLYSDGSTALASAAYAARAGLRNITLVAPGMPDTRLLPLMIYNSIVLQYQGDAVEALEWVREACQGLGIYETSTYRRANPYESEGPKTIGFEIFEQLGRAPDWVVVPVGGGGTLAGIWRAFVELKTLGLISKRPHMMGVMPEGYTLLETALMQGDLTERDLRALAPGEIPSTILVKIAMAFPPDGLEAIAAIRESEGMFTYASDSEALEAQKKLGKCEGIYAEPSAAISLVALEKLLNRKKGGGTIVAIITGSGFRETAALSGRVKVDRISIDADSGVKMLEKILGK